MATTREVTCKRLSCRNRDTHPQSEGAGPPGWGFLHRGHGLPTDPSPNLEMRAQPEGATPRRQRKWRQRPEGSAASPPCLGVGGRGLTRPVLQLSCSHPQVLSLTATTCKSQKQAPGAGAALPSVHGSPARHNGGGSARGAGHEERGE